MLRALFAVILLCYASVAAFASVTINNFDGTGTAVQDEITKFDDIGNKLDALDGGIFQCQTGMPNCTVGDFYYYGEVHNCGFTFANTSPYCGTNIYRSQSMENYTWHLIGSLIDSTNPSDQNRCKSVVSSNGGCFRPKIMFNATNNDYVLWQWAPAPTASNGYYAWICTSLDTPNTCTFSKSPLPPVSPGNNGDADFLVDGSNGYIVYSNGTGTRCPYVNALTSDFTDFSGPSTQVTSTCGGGIEGLGFFRHGTNYIVTGGQLCAYCTSTDTSFWSATTPLGAYTSGGQLNATSCNGQNVGTFIVTISGVTTYLYMSGLPPGSAAGDQNPAFSNSYLYPMTFTGDVPDAIPCNASITLPLSSIPPPALTPAVDQTDQRSSPGSNNFCNLTNLLWLVQPFIPSFTGDVKVNVISAKGLSTNGDLVMKLMTLDASNNPVTTLATGTVLGSSLGLTLTSTILDFAYNGTGNTTYGLVYAPTNTTGCFGYAYAHVGGYSIGSRFSTDGGSTWSAQTPSTTSIMFSSLLPPSQVPMGGLAANDNNGLQWGERRRVAR